tara:strand:- start:371 stop:523 length:153 start_codon:yes stop_codon:yes gene_type:complete
MVALEVIAITVIIIHLQMGALVHNIVIAGHVHLVPLDMQTVTGHMVVKKI